MKKFLDLFLICFTLVGFSQSPQLINYQGVARNSSGTIVTNPIGIKFQIYQGSVGGTLVYEETNTATPSSVGVFTVHIGAGAATTGSINTIGWGSGPYFLQVSIDPAGGTSYSIVGANKLVSVPYALFAEKAGNVVNYNAGNGISISSGSITNAAPDQTVNISSIGIATVTNAYPNFSVNVGPPSLTYNNGTKELTLSQGGTSSTATLTGTGSSTVALYGAGIVSVSPTGAGSTFTIGVPSPSFASAGPVTITGTYPYYTVISSTTVPTSNTITGGGIAAVSPTTGNVFNVNVPPVGMSFMPATGILTYSPAPGISTLNLNPALSFTNSVLGVGANTIVIPGSNLWSRTTLTATTLSNITDYVGIGTTAPNQKLDVIGYLRVGAGPTTADEGWLLFSPSPGLSILRAGGRATTDMRLDQNNNAPMTFWTNSSERMRILPNGFVGIGNPTPTSQLDVSSSSFNVVRLATTGANSNVNVDAFPTGAGNLQFRTPTPNGIAFATNNTDRMLIDPTGKVGIGTISPAAPLEVVGKTITDSIQISGSGAPTPNSVLVSRDNIGNAKWSNPVMFKGTFAPAAVVNIGTAINSSIGGTAGYSSATAFNVGGGLSFGVGTMAYTAPVTGYYQLSASVLVSVAPSAVGNAYLFLEIYNSTSLSVLGRDHINNSDGASFQYKVLQVNTVAFITQGQQLVLRVGGSIANAGTITTNYSPNLTNQFSGFLIK